MRPLFRLLLLLFAFTLVTGLPEAQAQVKQQTAEEQIKEQQKAKKAREKKIQGEMDAKQEHHRAIQTKKTRRRMKRNKRKSERMRMGKGEPFYRRWFRKKHFK